MLTKSPLSERQLQVETCKNIYNTKKNIYKESEGKMKMAGILSNYFPWVFMSLS